METPEERFEEACNKIKKFLFQNTVITNIPEDIIQEYIKCVEILEKKFFNEFSQKECDKYPYCLEIAEERNRQFKIKNNLC